MPSGFTHLHLPCLSSCGRGKAVFHKAYFKYSPISVGSLNSFEVMCCHITGKAPLLFTLVYRSPKSNGDFIQVFYKLLSVIKPQHEKVLICGDFSIHVWCPPKDFFFYWFNLVDSFHLGQVVKGQAHSKGHTLDLVFSHDCIFIWNVVCVWPIRPFFQCWTVLSLPWSESPLSPCLQCLLSKHSEPFKFLALPAPDTHLQRTWLTFF